MLRQDRIICFKAIFCVAFTHISVNALTQTLQGRKNRGRKYIRPRI